MSENKKHPTFILTLEENDEEREFQFEFNYLKSLTIQERFDLLFKRRKLILEILENNGHRRPSGIFKRT